MWPAARIFLLSESLHKYHLGWLPNKNSNDVVGQQQLACRLVRAQIIGGDLCRRAVTPERYLLEGKRSLVSLVFAT